MKPRIETFLPSQGPSQENESWLLSELERIVSQSMPDSPRAMHLGFAINYHLNKDPELAANLTIAKLNDELLGAVAWAVGIDSTGQKCLMIGEMATIGHPRGVGRSLMMELARQALKIGLEISCIADMGARGFYEHLGLVQDPSRDVRYLWTKEVMKSVLPKKELSLL